MSHCQLAFIWIYAFFTLLLLFIIFRSLNFANNRSAYEALPSSKCKKSLSYLYRTYSFILVFCSFNVGHVKVEKLVQIYLYASTYDMHYLCSLTWLHTKVTSDSLILNYISYVCPYFIKYSKHQLSTKWSLNLEHANQHKLLDWHFLECNNVITFQIRILLWKEVNWCTMSVFIHVWFN